MYQIVPWLRMKLRSESGAAAVEFAILAPLVFAILFGTLFGGLAWNSKMSLTHASREAARFGATYTGSDWHTQVTSRAEEAAYGELGPSIPGRYTCVALIDEGGASQRSVDGAGPTSGTCFSDTLTGQARVQVALERETDFIGVIFNAMGLTLRSEAVARYEGAEE